MSFLFAHNDQNEIDRARSVLSVFGLWFGSVQTKLPEMYDLHDSGVAQAARLRARLASVEFRNMVSGPVVSVQTSLRIQAFNGLPGPAFPLIFTMFGPDRVVDVLERASVLDHQCSLDVGLAYVDLRVPSDQNLRMTDPERFETLFEKRIPGRIIGASELRAFGGASDFLDIFVPEGERVPFSHLSDEGKRYYAKFFEEIYLDFAQWYERKFVESAEIPQIAAPAPAPKAFASCVDAEGEEEREIAEPAPVADVLEVMPDDVAPEEWEKARAVIEPEWNDDDSLLEDTVTTDRGALGLDLRATMAPRPVVKAVPPSLPPEAFRTVHIIKPTLVGHPAIALAREDEKHRATLD